MRKPCRHVNLESTKRLPIQRELQFRRIERNSPISIKLERQFVFLPESNGIGRLSQEVGELAE